MSEVLVLCYHAVSPSWPAPVSVTPARLEAQLELLVSRGYRGATLSQAVSSPPGDRTLAVTFDDGFSSVVDLALPIMSRLGLVGSLYVVTDFVGAPGPMCWPGIDRWLGGPHEPELAPVTWDHVGRLREAGWEIGSHTRSHPRLTQLDDRALAAELRGSREECERRTGVRCETLAYPYGDVDDRVVAAAAAAGYVAAAALPKRFRERPLEWPRVGVYHRDDERRFRSKVSPAVRRARASPAWGLAEAARVRLGGAGSASRRAGSR